MKIGATQVKPNGQIIRKGWEFQHTFAVPAAPNMGERKLERDSPLNHQTVTGIKIRRRTDPARSINGNPLVNDNAFAASFITLKQRNAEVMEKVPLEVIAQATEQGLWYEVLLPLVDMAQSNVQCSNNAVLLAGEDYEFVFRYLRVVTQKN